MPRIDSLDMTTQDTLLAMSDGNPGSMVVLMELAQKGSRIDPMNCLGGLGYVLDLDTLEIYDSRIWMLYKDVCGEHIGKVAAVLRGWQLGYLSKEVIDHAIEHFGDGLNLAEVIQKVTDELPMFNIEGGR